MRETTPTVRLVASPQVHWDQIRLYLEEIGGQSWLDRRSGTDAEGLVEFGGRLCYRSWEPGLNPNVTRVRGDSQQYLANIIEVGHGSVTEHAQFSFLFKHCSRVSTHEIVRHRPGVAISQESLRYVRLSSLDVWIPDVLKSLPDGRIPKLKDGTPVEAAIVSMVERLEDLQLGMAEAFELDNDGIPFEYKKEVTSAMRRVAPIGLATNMLWSANIRTLRHVIEMRTSRHAETEVRMIYNDVAELVTREVPSLMMDFTKNEYKGINEWVPASSKV